MFSPQASALLEVIRNEIQRYGQSIIGCQKLLVLVSESDPIGVQFGHIFAAAEREHWSIEFRNDGMIRFSPWKGTLLQSMWNRCDMGGARRRTEKCGG